MSKSTQAHDASSSLYRIELLTRMMPTLSSTPTEDEKKVVATWYDEDVDEMEELKNEPKLIIGLEIRRDQANQTIQVGQKTYIEHMLLKYNLLNVNPVAMLLDLNVVLMKNLEESDGHDKLAGGYAAAIGSLMYATMSTRPNIAFAIQSLSQHTNNSEKTCDLLLTYGGLDARLTNILFTTYSDADYAANLDDQKSISGYAILLAGAAIAWSLKK
ncbi:Retrovirus-related Pol polyprotein from transposon TNT 1-94 [Hypsizygus marmoreus]|uniref:Retrovirus-related Pol polyprotein from transposon TNT 1-94 n=1 Tax=Hypsizygus marmoreus TaxID=39966 RepID=A0A369JB23_HYPMA|nr:Retrovirus-related Pol polyprotein from transposon TNT 1-94 [Hypsizygus marmoreus]